MQGGDVLQVDTPDALYERPQTRDVASFIGTMNFMDGQVLSRINGHTKLRTEALGEIDIPTPHPAVVEGDRLSLAIRPEKIVMHRHAPDGASVQGTLEMTS